ncbi:MAG: HlyD family type I secretion periplasmic adaptor subunit [Steroidobacteraceae bacterium]
MKLQVANPSKLPVTRWRSDVVGDLVGAFESDTVAVFVRTAPINEHVILYVLAAMLVLAVGLTSVVKLDRIVNSVGRIVTSAGSLYISPFDTGIVREVHVKAGEVVKKGQALATLDPTFTHADLLQLQQKLDSDEAAVAREEAELAGRPYVFSTTDPYQLLQGGIWQKRQAEYRSNLASFDGQIHSSEAQVTQYEADAEKYAKRLKLASDQEDVYQPLLDKGYVSKLQLMQATDTRTEMGRLLSDAQNQISQYRQTLASLKAQRDAYIQKWHSDTGAQLVVDRNDLDVTRQNLQKAQKLSDLTTLDAPADAIVLKVGRVSSGSVASGGGAQNLSQEPLFTLVPLDAPVEADVNVAAADIGFIKIGDPVQLKLDAYRFMQHGTAQGTIKTISEGSFTVDDNNTPVDPYFKVRVSITQVHLRNVPADFRLVPGMTLAGDIMVGRRTILSYLTEGALRTGAEAMREP